MEHDVIVIVAVKFEIDPEECIQELQDTYCKHTLNEKLVYTVNNGVKHTTELKIVPLHIVTY